MTALKIKRGTICLVNLDPTIGSEIAKKRPAIVISNDTNNEVASTVTVIPLTSQKREKIYPFEVLIPKGVGNIERNSIAKANQIRTIDKRRVIKVIGVLPEKYIKLLEKAILIHLGLDC